MVKTVGPLEKRVRAVCGEWRLESSISLILWSHLMHYVRHPGNRLEALAGDRKGQHSIRINNQYRICFVWRHTGPQEVEITDYH